MPMEVLTQVNGLAMHGRISSSRVRRISLTQYQRGSLRCVASVSNGGLGRQGRRLQELPAYSDRTMSLREPAVVAAEAEGPFFLSLFIINPRNHAVNA